MYAPLIVDGLRAVVDSEDRERFAVFALSIFNEEEVRDWAARLNAGTSRDALVWTRMTDHEYRADLSPVTEDRTATGRAMAALRRREVDLSREVDNLRDEVTRLRTEQIKGHDHRLTEFWAEAQEAATRADYCEVFDNLAEALGGPTRYVEVDVTVSIPYTFTARVSRRDYADGDYSNLDPSDYIDRYSIDLSNAKIEEVSEV